MIRIAARVAGLALCVQTAQAQDSGPVYDPEPPAQSEAAAAPLYDPEPLAQTAPQDPAPGSAPLTLSVPEAAERRTDAPVPLSPGESIVATIPVGGAIVRVPERPAPTAPVPRPSSVDSVAFEQKTHSVTRMVSTRTAGPLPPPRGLEPERARNRPGWTGVAAPPASIGCFPRGSCAALNAQ